MALAIIRILFSIARTTLFATKIFSLSFKRQDIYRVFMKQTVKENKEPLKLSRIKNAIFNRLSEITNSSTSTN